jgi:hypothetical protein
MRLPQDALDVVEQMLASHGLILRGGFNFDAEEALPWPSGTPAKAVLLVGQAGAGAWNHFLKWRDGRAGDLRNPLDTWSREVISGVAERVAACAAFPFEKPYLPFQQWAMRAEGLKPSPLGILMHPRYGLWHAYRGALLFDRHLDFQSVEESLHLCDACIGKPCLNSCPVRAHTPVGFDHAGCLGHVRSAEGRACMTGGCLDRNACPYGSAYRYPPDMQAFHMAAFAA